MTKERLTASVFLMFFMVSGCDNQSEDVKSNPGVVNVEDDDPEMIAAIATAKRNLGFFEKNWQTMENDGYSMKFALTTPDGGLEHIWFSPTSINGNKIIGECANDPVKIPSLKISCIFDRWFQIKNRDLAGAMKSQNHGKETDRK